MNKRIKTEYLNYNYKRYVILFNEKTSLLKKANQLMHISYIGRNFILLIGLKRKSIHNSHRNVFEKNCRYAMNPTRIWRAVANTYTQTDILIKFNGR